MKDVFSLNSDLHLQKMLELHNTVIVVRSVFHEGNKFSPLVFIEECLCKL